MGIKIDPNSYVPAVTTLVQRGLIAGLAYFGATGLLSNDDLTKIASGVVSFGLIVWGAYRAYKDNEAKKAMEPYTPDVVANLKGK